MILYPSRTGKVNVFDVTLAGHRSLNVVAVADIRLKFRWVSLAYAGNTPDGRIWNEGDLSNSQQVGNWLPRRPGGEKVLVPLEGHFVEPYLVGDAAFSACPTLVKPFAGLTFSFIYCQALSRRNRLSRTN